MDLEKHSLVELKQISEEKVVENIIKDMNELAKEN